MHGKHEGCLFFHRRRKHLNVYHYFAYVVLNIEKQVKTSALFLNPIRAIYFNRLPEPGDS